jgi:hypothetical protein
MSDKFTIKIPREQGEQHNERRQEMGLTWAEYIDGEAPVRNDAEIDADEVARAVAKEVGKDVPSAKQVAREVEERLR